MATILANQTTNGTGAGVDHNGQVTVWVKGTFDNCEVIIEVSEDDSEYYVADLLTTKQAVNIDISGSYKIRGTVKSAGPNTDISIESTA